jgi:hypothetical protein
VLESCTAPHAAWVPRTLGALICGTQDLSLHPAGTTQFFGSLGLPPTQADLVTACKVVGSIALFLGVPLGRAFPHPNSARCDRSGPLADGLLLRQSTRLGIPRALGDRVGQARLGGSAFALPVRCAGAPTRTEVSAKGVDVATFGRRLKRWRHR